MHGDIITIFFKTQQIVVYVYYANGHKNPWINTVKGTIETHMKH